MMPERTPEERFATALERIADAIERQADAVDWLAEVAPREPEKRPKLTDGILPKGLRPLRR
jgi:hypothetical protein